METQKISEKDFIKVVLVQDNIEISIRYPKHTQLKTRFSCLDKLKEILHKI